MDRRSSTLIASNGLVSMILRIGIEYKVLNPTKLLLMSAQTISLADSPPEVKMIFLLY